MLGKLSYNVAGCILTAAVLLAVVPATFPIWGLVGAIWIISFSDLPVYLCNLFGLWREDLSTFRQDAEMTVVFVVVLAGMYYLRVFAGFPWAQSVALK
jgi:hypothetical protein